MESEREELARREIIYRDGRPPSRCGGKTVILVDDGLATGSTMRAAVTALRQKQPARDRRRRAGRRRLDVRRVSGDRRRMRLCHRP